MAYGEISVDLVRPGFVLLIENEERVVYETSDNKIDNIVVIYVEGKSIPYKFSKYDKIKFKYESHEF